MSAYSISHDVILEIESCYSCGVAFAMPQGFKKQRLQDRQTFYCPNGHGQHYIGETEAEKLRKQLATVEAARVQANAARWKAEEAKVKAERKLKRTEKRIKNGICPCCQRTFSHSRLVAHIKAKHPDFAAPETKTA
jgi:hypothetical protein